MHAPTPSHSTGCSGLAASTQQVTCSLRSRETRTNQMQQQLHWSACLPVMPRSRPPQRQLLPVVVMPPPAQLLARRPTALQTSAAAVALLAAPWCQAHPQLLQCYRSRHRCVLLVLLFMHAVLNECHPITTAAPPPTLLCPRRMPNFTDGRVRVP